MPRSRNIPHAGTPPRADPLLKECALFDLQRASRVISSLYNARLRASGITIAQFTLLRNIEALAPVSMARLAQAMAMERTSITRLIEPLIGRGLVETAAGEDRRVRNISLTPRARAQLRRARARWELAQADLMHALGPAQWRAMRDALRTTVKRVRQRHESAQ